MKAQSGNIPVNTTLVTPDMLKVDGPSMTSLAKSSANSPSC